MYSTMRAGSLIATSHRWGSEQRPGLEGSRRIERKDWGVRWNTNLDSGGVLVSDKITLGFEFSLIKQVDAEIVDAETPPPPADRPANGQ